MILLLQATEERIKDYYWWPYCSATQAGDDVMATAYKDLQRQRNQNTTRYFYLAACNGTSHVNWWPNWQWQYMAHGILIDKICLSRMSFRISQQLTIFFSACTIEMHNRITEHFQINGRQYFKMRMHFRIIL
jgi:hypothetical protein